MDTVKQVLEEIAGGTGKNVNCVDEEELLKLYYRIIKLASLYGVWHNMLREIEFCAQKLLYYSTKRGRKNCFRQIW